MKALSLKQPWATLILLKLKTIETRKWDTSYRGDLLICASKSIDNDMLKLIRGRTSIHPSYLIKGLGMAICMVELFASRKMESIDEEEACCKIYPNAHSFFLRNIRPIKPFPVKGQLNIFNIDVKPEEIIYL